MVGDLLCRFQLATVLQIRRDGGRVSCSRHGQTRRRPTLERLVIPPLVRREYVLPLVENRRRGTERVWVRPI
jgi:hypothetical protein